MAEKECEYCGEMYRDDLFFKFTVQNTPDANFSISHESGEACADCIATWFSETPEDVKSMMIWRA